jgi:FtsP/CotA-like multicopper oxidase with cupredoxin domain
VIDTHTERKEDDMRVSHSDQYFSTDTATLPNVRATQLVTLKPEDRFALRIAPVTKRLGADNVRMLAYNGSVPGPTLRVRQGSEILVDVLNDGDMEATVHWHGLRLDNRYDGTTDTQPPIPVGSTFTYRLSFPDPGTYWYHPHIREDYGQEMGLYGNIIVEPAETDYWNPANRELAVMLDDILLENGSVAPFNRTHPTYTAMGRFGNTLLVNGELESSIDVQHGEVVRLYLTNAANTRVFNIAVPGALMKLTGGDSGRYEREALVEQVLIAPSERAVVDVLFPQPGQLTLEHRTPHRSYSLATFAVAPHRAEPSYASQFWNLRVNADFIEERNGFSRYLEAPPDKTLSLVAEMNIGQPDVSVGEEISYYCPMHPDVVSDEAGRCPKCGMKLVPANLVGAASEHGNRHAHSGEHVHNGGFPTGIEWEDDMVEVNKMTNPGNMRWKLIDRETGAEGADIDWRFRVGDRVKIRLVNEMDSDHPMHHPFHLHGAGRFVILARDGVAEPNLVWKDTVLVPTGQTVDILLDVTHPGVWMAHCHIAEHHESGMMMRFRVSASVDQ